MNAKKSNLSAEQWGYDMVVGVTQDSINYTMMSFLEEFGQRGFECYFKKNPEYSRRNRNVPKVISITKDELLQLTNGKNPMEVEIGSDDDYEISDTAFRVGIKGEFGLPEDGELPNLVIMDQGFGTKVSFTLTFKNLQIRLRESDDDGGFLTEFKQDANNQVQLRYVVDLKLGEKETDAFNKLPEETKKLIKNLDSDTMFSVQQLYIDLTTPHLQDLPELKGIEGDNLRLVTNALVDGYWRNLKNEGKVMLGQTILPKSKVDSPKASLMPTDLDFRVTPYINDEGIIMEEEKYKGLYALNYLVMSENRPINRFQQKFAWNWVSEEERRNIHGAMAIRKERIIGHLKKSFDKILEDIVYEPYVSIKVSGMTADVTYKYNKIYNPKFTMGSDGNLVFYYEKSDHDQGGSNLWAKELWGNTYIHTTVKFENNKILFNLYAKYDYRYKHNGIKVDKSGYLVYFNRSFEFELAVKDDRLVVLLPPQMESLKSLSSIWNDIDGWFNTDDLKKAVTNVQSNLTQVQSKLENMREELEHILNTSNAWVFPGGRTFAFKNAFFSEHKDLVTYITYADPNK